jgi:hypothetical protein
MYSNSNTVLKSPETENLPTTQHINNIDYPDTPKEIYNFFRDIYGIHEDVNTIISYYNKD